MRTAQIKIEFHPHAIIRIHRNILNSNKNYINVFRMKFNKNKNNERFVLHQKVQNILQSHGWKWGASRWQNPSCQSCSNFKTLHGSISILSLVVDFRWFTGQSTTNFTFGDGTCVSFAWGHSVLAKLLGSEGLDGPIRKLIDSVRKISLNNMDLFYRN